MAENNNNNIVKKMGGEQKSNFLVTCSLLSKYLKEKGRIGKLGGLEKASRPPLDQQAKGKSKAPTTMSLLPGVDVSEENPEEKTCEQIAPKSMDFFQSNIFSSANEETDKSSITKEKQKAQMTIFYAGKVLVFDDFPADKAKDLMQIATKESTNFRFRAPPVSATTEDNNLLKPADASDMPIARRNSLHRFLEKRKDRISTKAPYQVGGSSSSQDAVKPDEDNQGWLGLAPKVPKLNHNCSNS